MLVLPNPVLEQAIHGTRSLELLQRPLQQNGAEITERPPLSLRKLFEDSLELLPQANATSYFPNAHLLFSCFARELHFEKPLYRARDAKLEDSPFEQDLTDVPEFSTFALVNAFEFFAEVLADAHA